jgi:hypothetical protein
MSEVIRPKRRTAPTHRDSAKLNRAERAEPEVGAGDEVSNGSRDDDLAIAGLREGPSRDVSADPSDIVAAEAFDLCARDPVMSIQEPAPSLVAERGRLPGRPDDVGEQHRRKDAIGVLHRILRTLLDAW